jgi:serine protease Do
MNTQAVVSEDGSASGVWVAAVSAGSPAAETGVEAGDLITEMNGLAVGDDGTMGDYCDILSSAGDGGAIDVLLVRTTTGEVLEGEFNGAPLEVVGSVEGDTPGGDGGDSGGPVTVTSDSGSISARIPAEWEFTSDTDQLTAAPDVDAFNSSFTASGLIALLIPGEPDIGVVVDELLADISPEQACDEVGRTDLDAVAPYTAGIDVAFDCGAAGAELVVLTGATGNTLAVFAQATPDESDVVLQVLESVAER